MKTKGTPFFHQEEIIPANFENLKVVGEFIDRACVAAGFNDSVTYAIQLAVDEACSNIIEHAYRSIRGVCEIECTCAVDDEALYVELHDHGEPFNPAEIPEPDITAELALRSKGGLGLYFIRRLMDEVSFRFVPEAEHEDPEAAGNFLLMVKYRAQAA